jgi:hypothetical protein
MYIWKLHAHSRRPTVQFLKKHKKCWSERNAGLENETKISCILLGDVLFLYAYENVE